METRLITICWSVTKFAEILKMASKMATEKRKWNISGCMADKTEIPSAKIQFCDQGMQLKQSQLQYVAALQNVHRYSRWRQRWLLKIENLIYPTVYQIKQKFQVLSIYFCGQGMQWKYS